MNAELEPFVLAPLVIVLALAVLSYWLAPDRSRTDSELERDGDTRKRKMSERDFSQPGKFTPASPLAALPEHVFFLSPGHGQYCPGEPLTFHNYVYDLRLTALLDAVLIVIPSAFGLWASLCATFIALDGRPSLLLPTGSATILVGFLMFVFIAAVCGVALILNIRLIKSITHRRKDIKRIEQFGIPLRGKVIGYEQRTLKRPKQQAMTLCDLFYEFVSPTGHEMTDAVTYIPRPKQEGSPVFMPLNDIPIVVMYVDETCYLPL